MIMDYWGPQGMNHHTEATTMLYAARESARVFLAEGAQRSSHGTRSQGARLSPGSRPLASRSSETWRTRFPTSPVCIPDGVDGERVRAAMLQDFGVEIGSSFGPLKAKSGASAQWIQTRGKTPSSSRWLLGGGASRGKRHAAPRRRGGRGGGGVSRGRDKPVACQQTTSGVSEPARKG